MNLEQKKTQILSKYKNLIQTKTGYTGIQLDNFIIELIKNGEKYYGDNFTKDVMNERRPESVSWLIDELKRHINTLSQTKTDNLNEWIQSLITESKMTANQAHQYATNPNNHFMYERWLAGKGMPKHIKITETIQKQPSEKQRLLEKHGELIKKIIFGGHFQGELNAIQKVQLNSITDILIETGKKQHGNNFVEELINNNATEHVAKILKNLLLTDKQNKKAEPQVKSTKAEPQIVDRIDNKKKIENQVSEISQTEELDLTSIQNQPNIPATAKLGKRKKAPVKLINKLVAYWKEASFKKKILIGAVAIGAIAGIAVVTATTISNLIATQSFDADQMTAASNMVSAAINNIDVTNTVDSNTIVDWSNIKEGTEVYTTMDNASENINTLSSNSSMQVNHMEAVDKTGNIINLDGMTNNEVINTLDSGDYTIRGSKDGTYMGWFTEDTVKNAIQDQGRNL